MYRDLDECCYSSSKSKWRAVCRHWKGMQFIYDASEFSICWLNFSSECMCYKFHAPQAIVIWAYIYGLTMSSLTKQIEFEVILNLKLISCLNVLLFYDVGVLGILRV